MIDESIMQGIVSDHTIQAYRQHWHQWISFAGSDATDPATFARWKAHLVRNTNYAPTTINCMLIAVRSILREATERGYLSRETLLRFTAVRGVPIKALKHRLKPNRTRISSGQMRTMVEQPDTETLIGLRDRALLLTLATSGCRISEVIRLPVGAITQMAGGWGFAVKGKTDTEARIVPISEEAKAAIDLWLKRRGPGHWIFSGQAGRGTAPISAVGARMVINRHAASAGLSNIKPHDFRRFVGTKLAERNPRHAQRVLGHASINTTMQYYVMDDVPMGVTEDLF